MESLTPVSTYISQTAKKRMFSGGSSSSRCNEVEVLGISPPANGSSASKSSKQKEVICHEIIDIDMEDDRGNALLTTGDVDRNGKGKEALSNFPNDQGSFAIDESGSDVQMSDNSPVDDSSSNMFYEEDEWIDTYYDDIVFDDYDVIQSHYDRVDIPPGVEMPFPWLSDCPQNNVEAPSTNASAGSSSQGNSNDAKPSTDSNSSSPIAPKKSLRIKNITKSLNSKRATRSALQRQNGRLSTSPLESGARKFTSLSSMMYRNSESSSGGSLPQKMVKGPWESLGKSKRRFHASHLYSGPYDQFPSGATFSSAAHNHSGYPQFPSGPAFPSTVHNHGGYATSSSQTNLTGGGTYTTVWQDMNMHMFKPSTGFVPLSQSAFFPMEPSLTDHQNGEIPNGVEQKNLDEILQNFDCFKKFDTVEDFSDHHYSKQSSFSAQAQPPKQWAKRIQEEWKILENDLPDTIFVRVYESRMDLLRAVIVGAEGTPYHDGLFFFDFHFPVSYPNSPPQVHYHSGGLRINPNLYNCGKVCLSLLNTWSGNHKEKWIPGVSTILQVLVSIQGLILNTKPFFNEPGYADLAGSESGELQSLEYNEKTFIYSLQTMVYTMRRPPKYFEDFAIGHFCKRSRDIMVACQAYLDGAQVCCLVKGGVQDVDEGDKSCSLSFKNNLIEFIPTLINTFSRIGVKDCDKFLSSAQNRDENATAPCPVNLCGE